MKNLYSVTSRYYSYNGLLVWISKDYDSLEEVLARLRRGLDDVGREYFAVEFGPNAHPHSREQVLCRQLMRTNIMVRDPSGKLIKWKHLL